MAGRSNYTLKDEEQDLYDDDDIDFPSRTLQHSNNFRENVASCASSSGCNLRSSFLSMGFPPSLVDKVIYEKGEGDSELILETLFAYSQTHPSEPEKVFHNQSKSNSESSDSFASLFGEKDDDATAPLSSVNIHPKDEPDLVDGVDESKRASLLSMNFSLKEVNFAMEKLGEEAALPDLVDFIFAAQMDENAQKTQSIKEDTTTEKLYGTMDKTLRLLEMGFTEAQVSLAIEKLGSEIPISELAHFIFTGQIPDSVSGNYKYSSTLGKNKAGFKSCSSDSFTIKEEESGEDNCHSNDFDLEEDRKGKKPKQEYLGDPSSCAGTVWGKGGPKILSHQMPFNQVVEGHNKFNMPKQLKLGASKSVDKALAKPPYFLYGNVVNLSQDLWMKMSNFLYHLEPEFTGSELFSAMSRREGYLHNLPNENRFHVNPKSPMTIEDAIPQTKRWRPTWDTRKHLSCISTDTPGISDLCERLGKILVGSHGLVSLEQQKDILHQCQTLNLMWAGQHNLAPIEPEQLEHILGYPIRHTQNAELSLRERLQSLKISFQTDTLGYHLSVLKSMFPEGLTVLSIFSGIGGAEVALHRLGIHLKGVVSVETSEIMRKILRRWWNNTGQTGELVQIEDIHRLTTCKLESLIKNFGGFDLIISQNPCTITSKTTKIVAAGDSPAGFDFSLFYEFVRVVQRVRSMKR